MGAVRSIFELAPRRGAVMQAEKLKVSYGPAPAHQPRGACQQQIARMDRAGWVLVPHMRAKALVKAARVMGGRAMQYAVDDLQSCVKVLDAPWKTN